MTESGNVNGSSGLIPSHNIFHANLGGQRGITVDENSFGNNGSFNKGTLQEMI